MAVKLEKNNQPSKMHLVVLEYILYPFFKLIYLFWYLPMVLIGLCRSKKSCVPTQDRSEIMKIPATEISRKIIHKEVTCRFVIDSYITRLKEVNPIINAIVEDCFQEAIQEADSWDTKINKSSKPPQQWLEEFPLLGVPITVKESIGVQGMSNTAGYFTSAERRASEDAEIISACRKAGCIIMALSNTPELCLNWETYNNLIGTTKNPYDTRRTCGGSSGGEAALIGSGASVLGLGSDIAGSLRLPAHYCCIFSHKPTAHVVSTVGHYPSCRYSERWNSHFSLGPLSRYAVDLTNIMKVITKEEFKPLLNLSRKVDISKVKIYYLKNFGSVLCSNLSSEISTAFDFLLDHLKIKHNTQVQQLDDTFFKGILIPTLYVMLEIKGVDYDRPKSPFLGLLKVIFKCSDINFNTYMYSIFEKYFSKLHPSTYKKYNDQLNIVRNKLEVLLEDDGVLLMPTYPRPADFHYTIVPRLFDVMGSLIFSTMGMPVSNCPIGINNNGLPFGIQVVSKRFNDRLTMAVAEQIELICGGWKMPD